MSGYTEISDPVDNANSAPSDNYAAPAPQYEDPFAAESASAKSTSESSDKKVTNSVDFDDNLTLGFVTKIMVFVGVGIASVGIFISLASGSAIPINPEWLSLLGLIAPLFLMMLVAFNRVSHALCIDVASIVLTIVNSFYAFFRFIAYAKADMSAAGNGVAAGDFITFAGEVVLCVASFLALYGF